MIEQIQVNEPITLEDYRAIASLMGAVHHLEQEAKTLLPCLEGRRVWMVNSTAQGGGVAEMLPKVISILNELGVDARWLVLHTDNEEFFRVTKHIHNMIHGVDGSKLTRHDRKVFEEVARENVEELAVLLHPDDILVIHDPQPLALGAMVADRVGMPLIWRCHIGLDRTNDATDAAWDFLKPYASRADFCLFSAPEYIPPYLAGKSSVLHPAIDPLSHKNRYLQAIKIMGVLCNSRLATAHEPTLLPEFEHVAQRLQPNGTFRPANENDDIGMPYRPIVTQVSRWDKLKGWEPLLEAFIQLKARVGDPSIGDRERRRLELVRLVLAGPDPASVSDDPEGREVLERLCARYQKLSPELQRDVALVVLPMHSRRENALMVNALQRCSSIVVQNSVEEGFGLTATEALFKRVAFLSTHACGIRQQVRDQMEGRLVSSATDIDELSNVLYEMLSSPSQRESYARNGQRRAHEDFLVFKQVGRWLETLATTVKASCEEVG